jgi:hypothetical protein
MSTGFRRYSGCLAAALLGVLVSYQDAHAYIDPSAGSYFLQIALSGLLGGIFVVKTFWKDVRAHFSRNDQDDDEARKTD